MAQFGYREYYTIYIQLVNMSMFHTFYGNHFMGKEE